ncbi:MULTISPECIES: DNA (cytosine-5-)-methyltransferase [Kitasatospora]|uniref:Cytosine-specific methyltransferase n=1 Tax=Kitasatospora setae (strain ATCC 33774 / DSM 43861 / JCM 3304 / KCC A-0304 / NBRC 14216 / KM-6054) TaxID=452652 RepID=E4NEG1_KITSK|nr:MULTISPECIES: DNA (cytosine-5-)-methyltransferase [Kitasatospora]BAJ29592.1 putative modification methylase [Kitasatospora setae KM-6054]
MAELRKKPKNDRTGVELFAGAGGLAMSVHRAGFRPLLFNEFAKRACETLEANGAEWLPDGQKPTRAPESGKKVPLVAGDVQDLDMNYLKGQVDVLAGGPPCQPFSLGGVAKGDEDKRNMFPQMFRAVREIQPKAVICENVRGLLRPSFNDYFQYILRELELPFEERAAGVDWKKHDATLLERLQQEPEDAKKRYQVVMTPVNAADYGVPQIRNRVIIVAFRRDLKVDIELFKELVKPTHSETALIRSMMAGGYWEHHADVPPHVREWVEKRLPKVSPKDDGLLPWRTLRDAIKGIGDNKPLPKITDDMLDRTERYIEGFTEHIGWPGARIYDGHTPNELDRPAKTVKAGVHGVPGGESVMLTDELMPDKITYKHRYMTVRETARVMTFPDDWELKGPRGEKMRQLGNAVPVLLGEVFAKAVATVLDKAEGRQK